MGGEGVKGEEKKRGGQKVKRRGRKHIYFRVLSQSGTRFGYNRSGDSPASRLVRIQVGIS